MAVMVASALLAQPLNAKEKWLRIISSARPQTSAPDERFVSSVEVLTDAGESIGRRIFDRLLLLRSALAPAGQTPLPVRVVVLANETEFASYRTDPLVKGFYQSGPDVDTIVLFAQGAMTYNILAHEFVHLVRNHQRVQLGRWLEEGLAEFYSTIEFRKGYALAGQDIEAHTRRLENPESSDEPAQYARGWALARAVILLVRGSLSVRIPMAPVEESAAAPIDLPEADGMVLRAGLMLQVGNHEAAATLFAKIAESFPNSAAAEMGLFQLAMFEEARKPAAEVAADRENAAKHVRRAIELGAGSEATFEYAMLLREMNAPRADIDGWLERTLALSPRHAEAHLFLGVQATAAGSMDTALKHLESAAAILPRQASVWHALGYAQNKAGQTGAARESARRALMAAKDDPDRKMAASLMALIDEPKSTRVGSAVITPDSWRPRLTGDRRVEGKLVGVDCAASGAVFHVETSDGLLALAATAETRVARLAGSSAGESGAGLEVPCPLERTRRVRIEYRRLKDSLVLTAIEFLTQ